MPGHPQTHVVERAFVIAKSGECANLESVLKALRLEGYSAADEAHLSGSTIRGDLRRLCANKDATTGQRPARRRAAPRRYGRARLTD